MKITVENIKCGGCVGSISKKLTAVFNTEKIEIDIEKGEIEIDIEATKKDELAEVLLALGYPEIDSVHGFNSAKAKAKSFVSCAIGKIEK
jgi:copper chaperone CopZ